MINEILKQIIAKSYILSPERLDEMSNIIGMQNWQALTEKVDFDEIGTGGGCRILSSNLPEGYYLDITDGEADLPKNDGTFCLAITDEEGKEWLTLNVRNSEILSLSLLEE